MPLEDISRATRTLANLIRINLIRITGDTITSSTISPSEVEGVSRRINIYLYHLQLDPFFLSQTQSSNSRSLLKHTPAKFILYYIITAHHNTSTTDQHEEERLIGLALKTLRDFDKIEDDTTIAGQIVMDAEILGLDNQFQIYLPNPDELIAPNFWNADSTASVRPAIYCELRNIEIIPEAPEQFDLPILSLGAEIRPNFGPILRILSSEMMIEIPINGQMETRRFQNAVPRILIGASPPSNRIKLQLVGDFSSGYFILEFPTEAGVTPQMVNFDIQSPDWLIERRGRKIEITFGAALLSDNHGTQLSHPFSPGRYHLVFVETVEIEHVDSTSRHELRSAPVSIHFSPKIISHTVAVDILEFTLAGDFVLDFDADKMALAVDRIRYNFADDADSLSVGEYAITDENSRTVRVRLASSALTVGIHPIQFWIFDEASQPYWYEV